MNWSLHYLTGQKKHCSANGNFIEIVEDPLVNGLNAHWHGKNTSHLKLSPFFFDKQHELINNFKNFIGIKILHLYSDRDRDERVALDACARAGARVITLISKIDPFRHRDRSRSIADSDFEYCCNHLKYQYKHLDTSKISTPGRLREFVAFNVRKWENAISLMHILDKSAADNNYFVLQHQDLLEKYEQSLRECVKWLGLKINEDRVKIWLTVAERWAADVMRHRNIDACWPTVVEAVVQGKDLFCGGLSLIQEGALIYDVLVSSGRFISARHLDVLPDNAKQINKLFRR